MSSEQKIQVLIDNKLYDLTKFAKTHPGGRQILENFNDCDATDYFYSIHSVQSRKMLKNMPYTDVAKEQHVPESDYLKLLFKLEKTTNLFKADYFFEITQILHTIAFLFLATYYSTTYPLFAACCLGFGTLIAGWIGHQADHQRDNVMRNVNDYYATLCAGLSPRWWSNKHNLHHLSTNEMDHDGDIQLMPFIYLWTPKQGDDSWNRGMQHIYFSALYSILQIKWQYDSVIYAFTNKYYREFALLMVHWAWYACLPWKVWVVGTLIAGTVSAWVVTASHQAETKLEGKKSMTGEEELVDSKYQIHDYFSHQVITTRNIDLHSWFLNYICGGMQYQIEHHIFPRIPLYKLSTVKPMVKELCAQRGIDYNEEDFWTISKRNYKNIEEFAKVKV